MDGSTFNKVQHQFWVTKQTVYRKLGKKEDEWIVSSDAVLDAKLELFKSIQLTSSAINKLLDRYQEKICSLAQEQNAMGRFLKEYGKTDKSSAGPMMIQMGKSLICCSQQEIGLRPPLLRLYQEVETFRNRAVEDTLETILHMEADRTTYRASLNWMKNVSQELDPDTSKHLEKFRKVQCHVKSSKAQFDKLKLACLQKVDLLAAARCNMFSHSLIQYHGAMIKNSSKNENTYSILAQALEGHQHFDFNVGKDIEPPTKKPAETSAQNNKDELLFDFGEELSKDQTQESTSEKQIPDAKPKDLEEILSENLLDDQTWMNTSPATENAEDALDLFLGLSSTFGDPTAQKNTSSSSSFLSGSFYNNSSGRNKAKEQEAEDLLVKDLESSFETMDTLALIEEICSNQPFQNPLDSILDADDDKHGLSGLNLSSVASGTPLSVDSFLPSQLLEISNLQESGDLLNLCDLNLSSTSQKTAKETSTSSTSNATASKGWHDIFASLDPIANPDAIGKKEETAVDSRYC